MKNTLMIISALLFSLPAFASNDCAENEENCWDCGKTANDLCTARKDGTKLTITGSGDMASYGNVTLPWGTDINELEIEGITSVGTLAFRGTQIKQINVPKSVSYLQDGAFQNMPELTNVWFESGGQVYIAGASFQITPKLQSLILPEDIVKLNYNNFLASSLQTLVLPDSLFNDNGTGLHYMTFKSGMTIYCSEKNHQKCENYFKTAREYCGKENGVSLECPIENIHLQTYEKYGDEYFANGKFYARFSDIGTQNNIKKRIYTVKEAEKLSKPSGNTFKLRYK
ncbi:MAG: leucine-rich repeat protein [Alphaproteobacteria bacterium]|nr:leucine-rich repeat protein [Alphaproteobacteria bacterium]